MKRGGIVYIYQFEERDGKPIVVLIVRERISLADLIEILWYDLRIPQEHPLEPLVVRRA